MRQLIQHSPDLFCQYPDHDASVKYSRISDWLDAHPDFIRLVADDLAVDESNAQGARGLCVDSVLRAAIYQADQGLTFRELEFTLADSMTAKTFCRVGYDERVSDSSLCSLIGMITQPTWEQIQFQPVRFGIKEVIDNGRKARMDATVTATNIHSPTDSCAVHRASNHDAQSSLRSPDASIGFWVVSCDSLTNRFVETVQKRQS